MGDYLNGKGLTFDQVTAFKRLQRGVPVAYAQVVSGCPST
jgi:hypothetical protein